uniref:Sema domain-containing protein n=1 Tax=Ciona savignyi TaxID=51511 RepID=H2YQI4_CIOSA
MSYGMVSRICRNDRGGGVRMSNNFMTFMSARLLCPYPGGPSDGRRSTYYNYLLATYKIGNTVYAVFTYPSSWGIPSTAICAFDLGTIDSHMEGTVFANNVTLYYDATSAAHTKTFTGSEALKPGQVRAVNERRRYLDLTRPFYNHLPSSGELC